MKNLTESDIIRIMREEWETKIQKIAEDVDLALKAKIGDKKKEKIVVSDELKVVHKKSGIRYTIDSVSPKDCVLRTPEGKTFLVDTNELEKEYELA
jgi:hypothetical protein